MFAGSGPVALAFPAQLHHYGANIALVCEAGPAPGPADVAAMLRAAPGNLSLLRDAIGYRLRASARANPAADTAASWWPPVAMGAWSRPCTPLSIATGA